MDCCDLFSSCSKLLYICETLKETKTFVEHSYVGFHIFYLELHHDDTSSIISHFEIGSELLGLGKFVCRFA